MKLKKKTVQISFFSEDLEVKTSFHEAFEMQPYCKA